MVAAVDLDDLRAERGDPRTRIEILDQLVDRGSPDSSVVVQDEDVAACRPANDRVVVLPEPGRVALGDDADVGEPCTDRLDGAVVGVVVEDDDLDSALSGLRLQVFETPKDLLAVRVIDDRDRYVRWGSKTWQSSSRGC